MKSFIKFLYQNLHWILAVFLVIYAFIPFLSPILFHLDHARGGWWIQTIYRFLCHQRPERSLFLFGDQITYTLEELSSYGYSESILGFPFIGNETIGYKVAFCVRDTFLYVSMALAAIFVAIYPRRIKVRWWVIILAAIPIALDGVTQFISEFLYITQDRWGLDLANPYYLSNNINRAVTGLIFGLVIGLFIFSEMKAALRNNESEITK